MFWACSEICKRHRELPRTSFSYVTHQHWDSVKLQTSGLQVWPTEFEILGCDWVAHCPWRSALGTLQFRSCDSGASPSSYWHENMEGVIVFFQGCGESLGSEILPLQLCKPVSDPWKRRAWWHVLVIWSLRKGIPMDPGWWETLPQKRKSTTPEKSGQHLKNNLQGWPLTFISTYTCVHVHPHKMCPYTRTWTDTLV